MPRVSAGSINMFYEMSGDGPPLLLIPGLTADHSGWMLQVSAFVAAGYRCIAIDNRDVGQSDESPSERYTIRDMADDAAALLDRIGSGPVHVIGYSMGGMIAAELALSHPARVTTLSLCATDAGQDPLVASWLNSMMMLRPKCDTREFCQVLAPWVFSPRFLAQPSAVEAIIGAIVANPFPQTVNGCIRQCQAILTHDVRSRLGSITMPTHVVSAGGDIILPPANSRVLAEGIRGSRLTVLPHLGHAALWEDAAAFNDAVLSFLNETVQTV
jgi:pimeloyl-ACP methyl ester carboxylesterase